MFDHVVFLEISGVCNAQCTFCCTGSRTHKTEGFMSVDMFRKILKKMSGEMGEVQLNLYNWGEPLIHPNFKEIIYEILKYPQFTYGISTNAGKIQVFDSNMLKKLAYLRISLPGFSQESFDKISKQNFYNVRDNIVTLVNQCRELSSGLDVYVDYHVYKFNKTEISAAEKFAKDLKIDFRTLYAYINDWKSWCSYVDGSVGKKYSELVDNYLFMDKYFDDINNRKSNYSKEECPIADVMTINHRGEVMLGCCAPYDDKRFVVGEFLEIPCGEISERINTNSNLCNRCKTSGFPYVEKIFYNG